MEKHHATDVPYRPDPVRLPPGRLFTPVGAAIEQGTTDPDIVEKTMWEALAAEAQFGLEYAAVVDANDLTVPAVLKGELRLLIAARLGRARLIDNLGVTV